MTAEDLKKKLDKEIKKEESLKRMIYLIIFGVFLCLISTAWFFHLFRLEQQKIDFMCQKIPLKASNSIIKYSRKYNRDWMFCYALLMTESNGKRILISRAKCKGYMQLAPKTEIYLRERLSDIIIDTSSFSTEFNIAGGILHVKALQDYYTGKDELFTAEVYNTGWYNYNGLKKRAPAHVKRFLINLTYFKTEWDEYRSFF